MGFVPDRRGFAVQNQGFDISNLYTRIREPRPRKCGYPMGPIAVPCTPFSEWRGEVEISKPWFWTQRSPGGPARTHLSFGFSVAPWCKGFVFGCGYVALRFQVYGFDFDLLEPVHPDRELNCVDAGV